MNARPTSGSIRVTPAARDALRHIVIRQTLACSRNITASEVLMALTEIAREDDDRVTELLNREQRDTA